MIILVHMRWIVVDDETQILKTDHERDDGYKCVIAQTSRNLSFVVVCEPSAGGCQDGLQLSIEGFCGD